ncbi:MAG: DMT family transporter [bacterium]
MGLHLFVWLLLSAIWGSTWLFIKIGLADLPPFTFAGIRFVIAVIPLLILYFARKPTLPKSTREVGLILFTGFLTFSLNYGLVFWGETFISSGLTAIIYTSLPLFGLMLAHVHLPAEPMTVVKTTGVLLGIAGVTLIFSNQIRLENKYAFWGALAIVAAALVTAYAGILIKAHGSQLDPLVLTIGQMLVGFMPLLAAGLILEGNPLAHNWTLKAWLSLSYLALIGSSLTFVLLYWLMQKMAVTKTQLIPLASTLLAVILGNIILNEALNWRTTLGGLGILSGLALTSWGYKRAHESKK